jgi:hypothetical protein
MLMVKSPLTPGGTWECAHRGKIRPINETGYKKYWQT